MSGTVQEKLTRIKGQMMSVVYAIAVGIFAHTFSFLPTLRPSTPVSMIASGRCVSRESMRATVQPQVPQSFTLQVLQLPVEVMAERLPKGH